LTYSPDLHHLRRARTMETVSAGAGALAVYRKAWQRPTTAQAMCDDYRAGFGSDSDLDRADRAAGRRIIAPLLPLWAKRGAIGVWYEPSALWRQRADDVTGGPVDATHFLAKTVHTRSRNDSGSSLHDSGRRKYCSNHM
jgi:hypothetical protein